jgi:hypothetical protein
MPLIGGIVRSDSEQRGGRMTEDQIVAAIVRTAMERFPTVGGEDYMPGNRISAACPEKGPAFSEGVKVEEVVRFVLTATETFG